MSPEQPYSPTEQPEPAMPTEETPAEMPDEAPESIEIGQVMPQLPPTLDPLPDDENPGDEEADT